MLPEAIAPYHPAAPAVAQEAEGFHAKRHEMKQPARRQKEIKKILKTPT